MSDEQHRQDELVSAYLDGEATPAEIAEVEASGVLLARVEQFRAMRDAVAEPVVPLSAEQRDGLIGAALRVADAEAADRVEAPAVPLHRPQRLLLAMAAAMIVLAAVVGTGLLAIGGDDDSAETAADAPAMESAAAPAADEAVEEAPMADMEMASDEAMAELEPMAGEARLAEEPMAEEADALAAPAPSSPEFEAAEEAAEEAEAAMAMAAEEAAAEELPAPTTAPVEPADDVDDAAPEQVVELGPLESLESLFESFAESWSAALEAGATAESGVCSVAVQEHAPVLGASALRAFVATVGTEDPATFDALFARQQDGTAVIIYASPPGCEISTHELADS